MILWGFASTRLSCVARYPATTIVLSVLSRDTLTSTSEMAISSDKVVLSPESVEAPSPKKSERFYFEDGNLNVVVRSFQYS